MAEQIKEFWWLLVNRAMGFKRMMKTKWNRKGKPQWNTTMAIYNFEGNGQVTRIETGH